MDPIANQADPAAKAAALEVLLHNVHGPFQGLPRTAGWGYPEPYTRDLLISALGILASGHPVLLEAAGAGDGATGGEPEPAGQHPSLVHDPGGPGRQRHHAPVPAGPGESCAG